MKYNLTVFTYWGRMTHICISKLTIVGSDNGLSPDRRQAITWTNAGILLIEPLIPKFNDILIEIHTFLIKKCIWKCRLWNGRHFTRPQCVNTRNVYGGDVEVMMNVREMESR